jgi:hypothetical protein
MPEILKLRGLFMKRNLLDLSGKIDRVRLLAFEKVSKVAGSLGVPFFIIGAAASDLALIIRNYTDAGNLERMFSEALDLVDSEDFDYVSVGARLLGRDIAVILSTDAKAVVLEILNNETGKQDRYRLLEDMMRSDLLLTNDFEDVLRWLEEVKTGILEGI